MEIKYSALKNLLLILIPLILNSSQPKNNHYTQTQATITKLEEGISGRRSVVTATVKYATKDGDSLTSQTRILHVPFIGALKDVGDTITIEYQNDNPYLIKSQGDSFLVNYGLYIVIGLGALFSIYRFRKAKT